MRSFLLPFIFLILIIAESFAGYKDDIGYRALQNELGPAIADGSSIPLVTQSEAATLLDHDGNDQTDKIAVWMPDPGHSEFSGKRIINMSGAPTYYSRHATTVGIRFYGKSKSLAIGIDAIENFLAGHWIKRGFLGSGDIFKPLISVSRLANHSWVGKENSNKFEVLHRLDWVIETDEYIQIVGPCLAGNPLWEAPLM